MIVKKILFIHTTALPGSQSGSRSCGIQPTWQVKTDAIGVHVVVPNKATYLYPWNGIERIEYEENVLEFKTTAKKVAG